MTILENIKHDIQTIKDRDPAATSTLEILTYSGLHAVAFYRVSHWFYVHKHKVIARCISQFARMLTGIEIHPGAKIGKAITACCIRAVPLAEQVKTTVKDTRPLETMLW